MAKAKQLSYYPTNYADVMRNAIQGGKEQLLDAPDRVVANRLRGQFYAYIGVLRREATAISIQAGLRQLSAHEEEILELAKMSVKLMISVEDTADGKALMKFTNRDMSWQAQMIANVRTGADIKPAPRLLPDGAVMSEDELQSIEMMVLAMKNNWPNAGELLANVRQENPHWIEHSADLREAIAQWEAERSLTHKPLTEVEQRVNDRLASYGFDPKKGGSL